MNSRLIKLLFSCAVGLYISLVCFNNVFDYSSNFPFVSMVAKMEDTFSKEKNGWRSINSSFLHFVLFILIVTWELLIAVPCLAWVFKNGKEITSPGNRI
jgi:predicted small integral membrane protein